MAKLKKNILIQTSVGIVLASENRPVLKDFLKAAGVKRGSYAAELLERIYAFFIDTSIDLTAEYKNYYESEYIDMPRFLYHKYAMNKNDLSKLFVSTKSHGHLLFIKSIRWGRDYQIDGLFEHSESGHDIIMQALNAKLIGDNDED